MPVSKNKRKSGNKTQKQIKHALKLRKAKKRMEEINQGANFFTEIYEHTMKGVESARLLVDNFNMVPWSEDAPAEVVAEKNGIVERHTAVINELETLAKSYYDQHLETQRELQEKTVDVIDANFRYIEYTTPLIEQFEYVIGQGIPEMEEAYLAKDQYKKTAEEVKDVENVEEVSVQ